MGALEECLRQVATENNWQIEIDKNNKYADDRLSRHTYISDGKQTVILDPSLLRIYGHICSWVRCRSTRETNWTKPLKKIRIFAFWSNA